MRLLFLSALILAACSGEAPAAGDKTAAGAAETTAPAPEVPAAATPAPEAELPVYGYRIVNTYPHDGDAFTQGLLWKDGHLYESTGRHGESSIRQVDLETGTVLKQTNIPADYFGEGMVDWNGTLISLTWRAGKAFIFDGSDFSQTGEFAYDGEGWGLTRNGEQLIMSDGSDRLRFLDPETFEVQRSLAVSVRGQPLPKLNELEWVDGEIFANIWQTDAIVRIDPASGAVTGVIDLSGLSSAAGIGASRDFVLNGIAWDPAGKRLFVTGKYWPALFEIELVARD